MKLPRAVRNLIESFEKLPGIGPKTAQRLTFYLFCHPQESLDKFAKSLENLKKETKECSRCFNVGEADPCEICSDPNRDQTKICVVEQPLDVLAMEKGGFYNGLYHVLGGAISPLNNIGPEEVHVYELVDRLKNDKTSELIMATNPNMEGEATAMYIKKLLDGKNLKIEINRLGHGLPIGSDLEYADEQTLSKAFEARRSF